MQTLIRRFFPAFAVGSVLFGTLALAAVPAYAAGFGTGFARPAVVGKVASVSGSTLTVSSTPWHRGPAAANAPAATTYTVNASGATVTKLGQTSSVANIAVGDFVVVQGTVSGSDVTATAIHDGSTMGDARGLHRGWGDDATSTPTALQNIKGNGEPVIGGTVSAITGSTLTVTAKAGQTYTVDASGATVTKPGVTSATLSNVAVGDSVVVQGTVNGTSVTASTVLDQAAPAAGAGGSGNTPPHRGFFGAIDGFFTHLFGFF